MAKKYINLPRKYISFSQMQMWRSSKDRYKELYFNGRQEYSIINDSMIYGTKFADSLENDTETGDTLTDTATSLLKKYAVRDKEMSVDMKTKNGWIKLLGKPDTYNPDTGEFREYKTGRSKWTQGKAEKHLQLHFYAVIIYLLHGKVVKDCYLDWVETHETQDGIQPTGRIETFKVKLGLPVILKTMSEIKKIAEEIELAWAMHKVKPIQPF